MELEAGAPVLFASVNEESDDAIRVLLIEDGVIDRGFLTDELSKQGFAVRKIASLIDVAPTSQEPAALLPLDEIERRHILRVLDTVRGNRTLAARTLGLDRKTLYRKLLQYRLVE